MEPTEQATGTALGAWIENLGALAYVVAPLFTVAVAILPIPAEVPAMLNGMMFGVILGAMVTWSGAMVGAIASFELARRYGRPVSERMIGEQTLNRLDRLASTVGWPGLLVMRLIPGISFTAINWGAGLTRIPRRMFFWTTAVGILPGTFAFTAWGVGLALLYQRLPALALILAGAALAVIVLAIRRYRRPAQNLRAA